MPISTSGSSNSATEIKQPTLATYFNNPYFQLDTAKTAVLFRAIAGGARTSTGTAYARSELREMQSNGTSSAAWNCTSTTRGMYLEQALLRTTTAKPEATIAQIHDATNDNLMVKYFGPSSANGSTDTGKLEARFNNDTTTVELDSAYKLGDKMSLDVAVSAGKVTVTYANLRSGASKTTSAITMTGISGSCYFKAGLYIQACSKVDIYGNTNTTCVNKGWSADKYETDPYAYSEASISKVTLR